MNVGIVGAGTAGNSAAIFLARAGHRVTLFERVAALSAVGAGITLQPTGLAVLAKLGLHEGIVARGARIDRLLCETKGGRSLVDLDYASIDPALFGLGIHRGVLFEALHGEAIATPGVDVRSGVEILHRERAFLVDRESRRHGPFDLLVIADGMRSQLRRATSTTRFAEPHPWGALWFIGREEKATRVLYQVADGNARFAGLLPSGFGPRGDVRLTSLFWSLRADRLSDWRSRGLQAWKDEVRALSPTTEPILAQIEDASQVLFASYHDVVMDRWTTRDVVYLGDAAHATSPQLGQGANLALWDAMVLADMLEAHDLPTALEAYCRARRDHLAYYQLVTRLLTPFFQGDEALLGTLRDAFLPMMTKIPPFRRMMTLSMLGVVTDFCGGRLSLSP